MYELCSSSICKSSWPVCTQNALKSLTEPGSVEMIFKTCALSISLKPFLQRKIGNGQFRPLASTSLSNSIISVFLHLWLQKDDLLCPKLTRHQLKYKHFYSLCLMQTLRHAQNECRCDNKKRYFLFLLTVHIAQVTLPEGCAPRQE